MGNFQGGIIVVLHHARTLARYTTPLYTPRCQHGTEYRPPSSTGLLSPTRSTRFCTHSSRQCPQTLLCAGVTLAPVVQRLSRVPPRHGDSFLARCRAITPSTHEHHQCLWVKRLLNLCRHAQRVSEARVDHERLHCRLHRLLPGARAKGGDALRRAHTCIATYRACRCSSFVGIRRSSLFWRWCTTSLSPSPRSATVVSLLRASQCLAAAIVPCMHADRRRHTCQRRGETSCLAGPVRHAHLCCTCSLSHAPRNGLPSPMYRGQATTVPRILSEREIAEKTRSFTLNRRGHVGEVCA